MNSGEEKEEITQYHQNPYYNQNDDFNPNYDFMSPPSQIDLNPNDFDAKPTIPDYFLDDNKEFMYPQEGKSHIQEMGENIKLLGNDPIKKKPIIKKKPFLYPQQQINDSKEPDVPEFDIPPSDEIPSFTPPPSFDVPPVFVTTKKEFTAQIIGDNGAKKFCEMYQSNLFQKLVIRGHKTKKLSILGWTLLCNCLNSTLEEFHITDFSIDKEKGSFIADTLVSKCPKLRVLDLWHNRIDENTAEIIMEKLLKIQTLEKVNLGDNDIAGSTKLKFKQLSKKTGLVIDLW